MKKLQCKQDLPPTLPSGNNSIYALLLRKLQISGLKQAHAFTPISQILYPNHPSCFPWTCRTPSDLYNLSLFYSSSLAFHLYPPSPSPKPLPKLPGYAPLCPKSSRFLTSISFKAKCAANPPLCLLRYSIRLLTYHTRLPLLSYLFRFLLY